MGLSLFKLIKINDEMLQIYINWMKNELKQSLTKLNHSIKLKLQIQKI